MKTMTAAEMTMANGGKMRYECTNQRCRRQFKTWVGALGHAVFKGHKEFYRIG